MKIITVIILKINFPWNPTTHQIFYNEGEQARQYNNGYNKRAIITKKKKKNIKGNTVLHPPI